MQRCGLQSSLTTTSTISTTGSTLKVITAPMQIALNQAFDIEVSILDFFNNSVEYYALLEPYAIRLSLMVACLHLKKKKL